MNEHWTTDPPEVGKRYKIKREGRVHESGVYETADVKFWPRNLQDGYVRSVEALPARDEKGTGT